MTQQGGSKDIHDRRLRDLQQRIHRVVAKGADGLKDGSDDGLCIPAEALAPPVGPVPPLSGRGYHRLPKTAAMLVEWIGQNSTPGAQVYVSVDGQEVASMAIGWARSGLSYSPGVMNSWLCCVKPILAIAFGQLWERGKVHPDVPVAQIVPEFGREGKGRITFRQLLSHAASLRPDPLLRVLLESRESQLDAIAKAKLPPEAQPGIEAYYSHAWAWFILAEAIERIDGRDFASYARDEILTPIGSEFLLELSRRDFLDVWPKLSLIFDLREAQPRVADGSQPGHFLLRCPGMMGLGSASAMGRIYEALLAAQRGTADSPVLMSTTVDALIRKDRTAAYDVHHDGFVGWGLGFMADGWFFGSACSPRTFGHVGGLGLVALADPANQVVIAFVLNGMIEKRKSEQRDRALADAIFADLGLTGRRPPPRIVDVDPPAMPTWSRHGFSDPD